MLNELKQSRIDLCLVKEDVIQQFQKMSYNFTAYSDHAVMSFQIGECVFMVGGSES